MTGSGLRRTPRPVVGPGLRRALFVVFALFAVLSVNAAYLGAVTFAESVSGESLQGHFYQYMFLAHVALGLILIAPFLIYGFLHMQRARHRPNRRAVRVGYALFITGLGLLITGLLLTRGLPWVEIRNPAGRTVAYWLHVGTPFVAAWLFVLHRLAGRPVRWRIGGWVTAGAVALSGLGVALHAGLAPEAAPQPETPPYFPALIRVDAEGTVAPERLMNDEYCAECHADVHEAWSHSVHKHASFNNPAYRFSVNETRAKVLERDGNLDAARFCAGCHDPVPLLSGELADPAFDLGSSPSASAGVTCTVCHSVTAVNSPRGNADFTLTPPRHYPFVDSENSALAWVNRALIKAKPDFHRRTFLKPLHQSPEFCGTCHKVSLPEALNGYRWLRGQNHYDSFLLSGVSGHGIRSFYYPAQAHDGCNGCHMPARPSDDFGARVLDDTGVLAVHDHQFPAANTAIPALAGMPDWVNARHREMLENSLRVDVFGLREGRDITALPSAPLRPGLPSVRAGRDYVADVVLRTLTLGHLFTQGTADSNEIWLDVTLTVDGQVAGRSGARRDTDGAVDPWSYFVNSYVIDRSGRRIDRRNAEDIFTALYNHQIPPGAASVTHYGFRVPDWAEESVELEVALRYRKFDATYMAHFQGEDFAGNNLPVTTITSDRVAFPVAGNVPESLKAPEVPGWQRWNDYGIGLLRAGELRQAEAAFRQVEAAGESHGPLNLARVYLREGRLPEASGALARAAAFDPPAFPWSVAYFTAVLNRQNGFLDEAIAGYRELVATRFEDARRRGLDFSRDYRLLNDLAAALFERSRLERGDKRRAARDGFLNEAAGHYRDVLALDPENAEGHWGLSQVLAELGDRTAANHHRELHGKYKVDDNAQDRAVALARRADPAADHAAEDVVIYDLQRTGAWGLGPPRPATASR